MSVTAGMRIYAAHLSPACVSIPALDVEVECFRCVTLRSSASGLLGDLGVRACVCACTEAAQGRRLWRERSQEHFGLEGDRDERDDGLIADYGHDGSQEREGKRVSSK